MSHYIPNETFTYAHPINTAFNAAQFGVFLPGAYADTGNDAWLTAGVIKRISASAAFEAGTGKAMLHVYDALVESTQQIVKGGTGTARAGKVALGATYVAERSWANPKTGTTVETGLTLIGTTGVAALPANLTGLHKVASFPLHELASLTSSVAVAVDLVDLNLPCLAGMVLAIQNLGPTMAAIVLANTLTLSVEYEPRARGYERFRGQARPNRSAFMV